MQNEYDIKKVMEEIELQLITSMKRTLWSHKEDEKAKGFDWPQWQALKLKQFEDYKKANKEIFNNNTKGLNRYLYKHIKEQFKEGAGRTNKQAIQSGIIRKEDSQLGGSFFGLNHRKLDALAKSTKNDMKDVKYATLRMANDQYRQIIYKAQVFANTGARTVKQAIDMASKDFLTRGFNCIEYSNGSRHNIADYCDMAIRTANKRANLMGEGEMRKKLGNPLVYISKHGGACDKCTQWEGRVYIDDVWSGGTEEDGKYPMLSTAIAGGLFHPRCHHGISTYYEDINGEPKEVTKAKHNHDKEDKYTQYLQQRQKQYQRLVAGSLLPENVLNYQNNVNKLQNQIESSKIGLSNEEQYAVNQYISSESYKINETLRNNIKLTDEQKRMRDNLDSALNKCNNYNGNIVRVLEIKDKELLKDFLKKNKIGKIENWKEYLSFSDKESYNKNANIKIYVNSTRAKDIRKYNETESEILYQRNSKFITKNIVKQNGIYYILWEEVNE
nr:MAG TPA: minor capsid protein [Caudoviricetes sp.]